MAARRCGSASRCASAGPVGWCSGGVSPWQDGALERIDQLVEEHDVKGLKLYPMDLVSGEIERLDMGDPEVAFPIFERAEKLGIKVVAIHKALPLGPVPIGPFQV